MDLCIKYIKLNYHTLSIYNDRSLVYMLLTNQCFFEMAKIRSGISALFKVHESF